MRVPLIAVLPLLAAVVLAGNSALGESVPSFSVETETPGSRETVDLSLNEKPSSRVTVKTTSGIYSGGVYEDHISFKGIRFAKPPVGPLRFAPPEAHVANDGAVKDAVAYTPGCPQKCMLPSMLCPTATDEDCLFLNIFTPLNGPLEKYSGGGSGGSAAEGSGAAPAAPENESEDDNGDAAQEQSRVAVDPAEARANAIVAKAEEEAEEAEARATDGADTLVSRFSRKSSGVHARRGGLDAAAMLSTRSAMRAKWGKRKKGEKRPAPSVPKQPSSTGKNSRGEKLLPVIVFIAGGAFFQGSSNVPLYDGRKLVQEDVIYVSPNYRLGALGFMVPETGGGNWGILDQRLALEWVRDNIHQFGGDPTRVTLIGESAGAASVAVHLAAVGSRGLFQRAVMESNPWSLPLRSEKRAKSGRKKLYKKLGCKDVACLRGKPADDIVKAQDSIQLLPNPFRTPLDVFLTFAPVKDDVEITDTRFLTAFNENRVVDIPVMVGSNLNEGEMFVHSVFKKDFPSVYLRLGLPLLFGLKSGKVLREYKPKKGSNREVLSRLFTDYLFACPARQAARAIAYRGGTAYLYRFEHSIKLTPSPWGERFAYCEGIACHGSELPMWFGTAQINGFKESPQCSKLSKDMITLWTNFAKSKDASPGSTAAGVKWEKVQKGRDPGIMLLKSPESEMAPDDQREICVNIWGDLMDP